MYNAFSFQGVREATFHPGGSLSVDPQDFWTTPVAMVSLGFRTMENKGVLLRTSEEVSPLFNNG
jgi:hypothetical protein